MRGVRIEVDDSGVAVALVDEISDEMKGHLRERLAAYCYGAQQATEDSDYYSYENTIEQLLERFDGKSKATKIGMAGELLVHVLISHTHQELSPSAVFLNKEERSIKKGFDLTFHATAGGGIWYGEVKSGEIHGVETADEKSATLLRAAANDVAGKLGKGARRSRWDAAIWDAMATLESHQADSAKELLRSDARHAIAGTMATKNVVVAAVVMHSIDHCSLTSANARAAALKIRSGGEFSEVYILAAQQHALDSLIDYLRPRSSPV